MKITILEKALNGNSKTSKEIEVNEDQIGVMNHRDRTVDYKTPRGIIRFTLTEDGFNDLIQYFKKPKEVEVVENEEPKEIVENEEPKEIVENED
jgi:hypothetical protein